jgi:DNA-damage-inducible protein J
MLHHNTNIKPKDAAIRVRVNHKTKNQAEHVLHRMGMTMSQAVNIYLNQIIIYKSIPFNIEVPNKETIKIIKEARAKKGLIKSKDLKSLFEELGI